MSFEEEWAQHKANAAAQRATGTRLDQLPADRGGAPAPDRGSLVADTSSINGNAHVLIEIAGLLHQGRPDGDLCTLSRSPRAHPDVARRVDRFARFADDQYRDACALFTALSTRLKKAGSDFVTVDGEAARTFLDGVLNGAYVAPEAR
jgi:hypothetical protein